ncbi:MAG: polymer-forming cytoskeletal protein [Deltaproteobacteria bacterium]|nr:polymer-forming cytoskeletal protein [Deltaproteobacteria bacterium]
MKQASQGVQTLLGPETTLEGKLAFEGTVRLDGRFNGSIESKDGVMIVGKEAVVNADIFVHTATVSGTISGNIRATHSIALYPPAQVFGDLQAPVVVIEPGVIFRGHCFMKAG